MSVVSDRGDGVDYVLLVVLERSSDSGAAAGVMAMVMLPGWWC